MKNITKVLSAGLLAMALCACSSSDQNAEPKTDDQKTEEVSDNVTENKDKDFDGSAYEETTEGTVILRTAGGTSENGNVPEIASNPDTLMTVGVDSQDFPGNPVVTVYVDGKENTKLNFAGPDGLNQAQIELTGDNLTEGAHTIEFVKIEGDTPEVYKKVKYNVVSNQ